MYNVTIRKADGFLIRFIAPTLPEAVTKLAQETIEVNKHYLYVLTNGSDMEYRTPDAAQPSVFDQTPPVPVPPQVPVVQTLFDPNCWLNKKLADDAPLHARNADFKAYFDKSRRASNAWIWADTWSTPIYTVTDKDPLVPVYDIEPSHAASPLKALFEKGIRLPADLKPATGGDHHACILNLTTGELTGVWLMQNNGRWECRAEEYLPNYQKSDGTVDQYQGYANGARASCITLPAGLILHSELEAGVIPHALLMVVPWLSNKFVFPARKSDGGDADPNAYPMGTRLRLPANVVIDPNWSPLVKAMAVAARDYGVVIVDNNGGGGMAFMIEDRTRLVPNMIPLWMKWLNWNGTGNGGPPIWEAVGNKTADGQFPFSQMQVLA